MKKKGIKKTKNSNKSIVNKTVNDTVESILDVTVGKKGTDKRNICSEKFKQLKKESENKNNLVSKRNSKNNDKRKSSINKLAYSIFGLFLLSAFINYGNTVKKRKNNKVVKKTKTKSSIIDKSKNTTNGGEQRLSKSETAKSKANTTTRVRAKTGIKTKSATAAKSKKEGILK